MRNRNRSRQQPCKTAIDEASVLANLSALMGSSPLRRRYGVMGLGRVGYVLSLQPRPVSQGGANTSVTPVGEESMNIKVGDIRWRRRSNGLAWHGLCNPLEVLTCADSSPAENVSSVASSWH